MADVSIYIADQAIRLKLKKLKDFINENPQLLERIGVFIKGKIVQRTLQGKDVDGNTFAPYSPGYAKLRAMSPKPQSVVDRTGVRSGLSTKPDLFFSGRMIGAITHTVETGDNPAVILFFARQNPEGMLAAVHNSGGGRTKKRKFFGISEPDVNTIRKMLETGINKAMKG